MTPPLLTDRDLHDHDHAHAPDDPSVTMPGGQVHLEWHQQRRGGSRDHAHAHVNDHRGVWEHHRERERAAGQATEAGGR